MNILFVCLGNICRSPLAEGIFQQLVKNAGLEKEIYIDSAGTGNYHIGELADPRTRETSLKYDIELTHCARQLKSSDFSSFDYILAMDKSNLKNIELLNDGKANLEGKLFLMRRFDPGHEGKDVPDPYFGGMEGFEEVHFILSRTMKHFLNMIVEKHFQNKK